MRRCQEGKLCTTAHSLAEPAGRRKRNVIAYDNSSVTIEVVTYVFLHKGDEFRTSVERGVTSEYPRVIP
jgi:hypothetical protein